MVLRRGDLALVPCRNGIKTAALIKSHLEDICTEQEARLGEKKEEEFTPVEERESEFIRRKNRHGIEIVSNKVKDFNDGEILPTIEESVRGKDVFLIQNVLDPEAVINPVNKRMETTSHNILEMLLTLDALKRADCANLTLLLPYLSYGKQERRQGRQSASAKVIIDALYMCGADKLITMDVHTPAIQSFSGTRELRIENLYASAIMINYLVREMKFDGVFVAPDANAGKNVVYYSKIFDMPMALGYKSRKPDSHHDLEEMRLLGSEAVQGKRVVIVDDQIAGGKTTINMATLVKNAGASEIHAVVTHAMLLHDAEEKFRAAVGEGLLKGIIVTNTLPHSEDFFRRNPYIMQLDAMKMFAYAIFETHTDGSISSLYSAKLREAMFGSDHKA